jgi:hypothetical protein
VIVEQASNGQHHCPALAPVPLSESNTAFHGMCNGIVIRSDNTGESGMRADETVCKAEV